MALPDYATGLTRTADLQFDQTAYNLAVDYTFRPENYFDQVASVMPTAQSMPGKAVVFPIVSDLAIASTALDESNDITPAVMGDNAITVTLAEYGNAVRTSAYQRGTSYIAPFDPVVANVLGYNAGASIDILARDVLVGGTQVFYPGAATARANVIPTQIITADLVRNAYAFLQRNNVPRLGGYYVAYIHPDVSFDLRSQTGSGAWRTPHEYVDTQNIYNGEIGLFEGFRFIEAPRNKIFADAGSSTTNTDVYATMFMGAQALAKAYSFTDGNGATPRVVPGPVTDILRRFVPLGWYWLGGYGRYRDNIATVGSAMRRLESASSIGANAVSGTGQPTING